MATTSAADSVRAASATTATSFLCCRPCFYAGLQRTDARIGKTSAFSDAGVFFSGASSVRGQLPEPAL